MPLMHFDPRFNPPSGHGRRRFYARNVCMFGLKKLCGISHLSAHEAYLTRDRFFTIALLQKELSMLTNLIIKNDRDFRIDSANDKDHSVEVLPLTIDQLSWIGGGEGIVNWY
jgi:hypothetical protein